jgi:hypothetical protein
LEKEGKKTMRGKEQKGKRKGKRKKMERYEHD